MHPAHQHQHRSQRTCIAITAAVMGRSASPKLVGCDKAEWPIKESVWGRAMEQGTGCAEEGNRERECRTRKRELRGIFMDIGEAAPCLIGRPLNLGGRTLRHRLLNLVTLFTFKRSCYSNINIKSF
jgi:hypothetical protein